MSGQEEFKQKLGTAVESFDKATAAKLCGELILQLNQSDEIYPEAAAAAVLNTLRQQRYFDLMQQVADALLQSGQTALKVRQQYVQSLIDTGSLSAAQAVLEGLVKDSAGNPGANAAAMGLVGRLHKQRYVNAGASRSRRTQGALQQAMDAYYGVYSLDSRELYHGINAVAVVARARRDGVELRGAPDPSVVARAILQNVEEQPADTVPYWDCATAAEACVALGLNDQALAWIQRYVAHRKETGAFALASTLRQFTEVWELDKTPGPGANLLTVLRSQLLARQGGEVEMKAGQVDEALVRADDLQLQRILGTDGVQTLKWYRTGLERCRAVARIETESGEGFGTGFLVQGKKLHPSFGDGFVLVTNAHVISNDPAMANALRPEEAVVTFEALGEASPTQYRIAEILWTSPSTRFDATIARLDQPIQSPEVYPLAPALPLADGRQRVYILGHPGGRTLSISLHDNLLLDLEDPIVHYRAPTEGGSSGSPVFNQQWGLIGLHHAGGLSIRRLRSQPGTYQANEGIGMRSIIAQIAKDLAAKS